VALKIPQQNPTKLGFAGAVQSKKFLDLKSGVPHCGTPDYEQYQ
jgi:hypothetical protein